MDAQTILLSAVIIPLAGAFVLPLAGKISPKFRNILALLLVATPFILLLTALPAALSGAPYGFTVALPLGLSFGLLADGLAVFMALTACFIGLIIVIYSWGYMAHYGDQNEYYLCVVLFIGAMAGITLSTDLVFLYVFWEISAFCCWRLIGFFREPEYVRRANKAFLITGAGALLMLAGFLMIFQQYGTTDMLLLRGKAIPDAAMVLILFGIFAKSATLPLHSWLADAGIAPHIMVEDLSVVSIAKAREAYVDTDLRLRLARYHDNPDSAFWGWNDIWLHPDFRAWNIEEYLPGIACPVLAIQGEDDEYGTMEQMRRIGAKVKDVELLALEDCRHSPHRDQPDAVLEAVTRFVDRIAA